MLRALILTLVVLSFSLPLHAEAMEDQAYTATLLDLNKVKPGQNPDLIPGKAQLGSRIIDKNQRTIGKVNDIVIAPDGKFQTILSKISIAGFREDVAFDAVSYITDPTPDTFTVSLDKEQLKQNMAKLMAATSVAAGPEGPLTILSLQNATVYKADGTAFAKVKDVLVHNRSMKIASLLLTLATANKRGMEIAIPYEASGIKMNGRKAELTVTDVQAGIISSMATR